ncbi:MAG TPA: hypothetical protein VLN48_16110, partial [Bryobacteraceae bacterium]|nr:hypothetical protein [Bryobacteraceae bacterium]
MLPRLFLTALIAAASAPAQGTVEIENAWVRVLRIKQGPHEKAPEHQHPASVAVYLTDIHQRVNGMEINRKAGDVAWLEA